MKVRFMCSDHTWLSVDNANINNLDAQCWSRARRAGKAPTKPLVWEVVSESKACIKPNQQNKHDDDDDTPKWEQLQWKL